MSPARSRDFPVVDLPRAKALRFAPKPALAKFDPAGLRDDRLIATALSAVMDAQGMTNVRLAEILGISESIVRRMKSRDRPVGARHLLKLEAEAPEFHAALVYLARQVLRAGAQNDNVGG